MTRPCAPWISPLLRRAIGSLVGLGLPICQLLAQSGSPPAWTDPSPHQTRTIAVAPDVRLEVLDWGGSGPAMFFLAGIGGTPHAFDDFAPQFRDRFRVYGVTRRGFGASSQAADGYDAATRARDVITVLDSLGVERAILVGHSFAGDELSKIGAHHPRRVRALVYLDAYDYPPGWQIQPPRGAFPEMTPADSASPGAVSAYFRRVIGIGLPEAEVRAYFSFGADGRLTNDSLTQAKATAAGRAMAGGERSAYARIAAPALAIYTDNYSASRLFTGHATFDVERREAAERYIVAFNAWQSGIQNRFRTEVAGGRTLIIPGAHHYIFISHADRVEREMRDFLASLQ